MTSVPPVARTMRIRLTTTAETAARQTGCVQRRSKLTGAGLVQTLVLGWLGTPAATLQQLAQMAARLGIAVTPQVIAAEPVAVPLWRRFRAVLVQDSTTITLPAGRAQTPTAPAGVKLQVRWDLRTGQLIGPVLTPARTNDRRCRPRSAGIAAGCRLNRQRQAPSTGQLLLVLEAGGA